MFYVLGIITSGLCFCSVWALSQASLSLTVVTEATAAGEQSTSVTSLCTVCHGNRVHKGQRSKVKLCEVVIELGKLQPSCLPLWLTLSEALIFEVTPRVLTTKVKYKQVLLSFYAHKGGLIVYI